MKKGGTTIAIIRLSKWIIGLTLFVILGGSLLSNEYFRIKENYTELHKQVAEVKEWQKKHDTN